LLTDRNGLEFYIANEYMYICLQCFNAVGWVAGMASGL